MPTQPLQPSRWKVEDGELVGRNSVGSWLFSEAGSYEDFHLRAEVKLSGTGDCGLYFRAPGKSLPSLPPPGLGIDVAVREGAPLASLWQAAKHVQKAADSGLALDQWFTLEVIAVGPRLKVLVNGKTVADYTDPGHEYRKGHIGLQQAHSA